MSGPLAGIRIVELAGLGPVPFAVNMLANMGAEVVRISRPPANPAALTGWSPFLGTEVYADLKNPDDVAKVLELVDGADVFLEGMRPGVTERLGLGPNVCVDRNSRLIYGRMTGWGQEGPMSKMAGHDINYISLTGILHSIGPKEFPVPPMSFIGDYGGGSLFLIVGILTALFERTTTGQGQVIDAAVVDGASVLMQPFLEMSNGGAFSTERESNSLDGGAPYYRVYECKDGKFVAVGAMEPQFYSAFTKTLGLDETTLLDRDDKTNWLALREQFAAIFLTDDRDSWTARFEGIDACVTPVLTHLEAPDHPHMKARNSITRHDGELKAAPAPRLSAHPFDVDAQRVGSRSTLNEVVRQWK
ncbi:unannotated protein [freshwater metagenome]|uniref:Unannotated protein n=1 Tax=freshwater metagenome TaxID=449393 RepID=A0A6J6HU32_9ZZZZ|nr:CoA transferase [Actinomycetota bacterium]MSY38071.1 CoA transferase [Actinomycetota bacterium]MSZ40913.1 CoA transferase [Actinomycetota bacterium]